MYGENDPLKIQVRSINFSVHEYKKFTVVFSDSTLQLNYKKLPSVTFGGNTKEGSQKLPENYILPSLFNRAAFYFSDIK